MNFSQIASSGKNRFLLRYPIPLQQNFCYGLGRSFMLNDASGFRRIYLATDYTDLRRDREKSLDFCYFI